MIDPAPTPRMAAMEANLLGHVAFVQQRVPGMTVTDHGDLVVVDSGLASDTFNKVLNLRLSTENADQRIEQTLTEVQRTGRPFTWWIGPGSRPLDLEERLRAHGFREEERELGMAIDLDKIPAAVPSPPDTVIQRVTTPAQLNDFAGVLADLSEPPDENVRRFFELGADVLLVNDCPMRLFVAYVDGVPAAVSELFAGADVAGVHMVATATAYRRRGLGMALTWKVLEEGRRLGLSTGTLQASAEGQPVYEKLGFEPCGSFSEYVHA